MPTHKIEFYFDFLSPYSYLAWTWVRSCPYDIEFYPVSMASIITSYETKGPAQIEPKRNYLFRHLLRHTKLHNIPFTTPKELPFNSLYALRLSLQSTARENQKAIIDSIYRAGWERGEDIGNDDQLKLILEKDKLLSNELIERMESKEARLELKRNNARALERGVFGVPTFIYNDELFWGHDSIEYLERTINGNDPLDVEKYKQFINLFTQR